MTASVHKQFINPVYKQFARLFINRRADYKQARVRATATTGATALRQNRGHLVPRQRRALVQLRAPRLIRITLASLDGLRAGAVASHDNGGACTSGSAFHHGIRINRRQRQLGWSVRVRSLKPLAGAPRTPQLQIPRRLAAPTAPACSGPFPSSGRRVQPRRPRLSACLFLLWLIVDRSDVLG